MTCMSNDSDGKFTIMLNSDRCYALLNKRLTRIKPFHTAGSLRRHILNAKMWIANEIHNVSESCKKVTGPNNIAQHNNSARCEQWPTDMLE